MQKTNEDLAMEAQGGDVAAMHELWGRVFRYVAKMARRWTLAFCDLRSTTKGDLINSGYIAMVEAVRTYSREKGAFLTWFTFYLKKEFLECYGLRRKQPDPLNGAVSLDRPIKEDDGEDTLMDFVADPDAELPRIAAEERIYQAQLHDAMETALEQIPAAYSSILRDRYYRNKSYQEISAALDTDQKHVRALESKALRRLRDTSGQELSEFGDFNYYRGSGLSAFRQRGESIQEQYLIWKEKSTRLSDS